MDKDTAIQAEGELRAIRVSLVEIDSEVFVEICDCLVEDGELVPTSNCLIIRLDLIPSMIRMVEEADGHAQEDELVPDDTQTWMH